MTTIKLFDEVLELADEQKQIIDKLQYSDGRIDMRFTGASDTKYFLVRLARANNEFDAYVIHYDGDFQRNIYKEDELLYALADLQDRIELEKDGYLNAGALLKGNLQL